MILTDNETSVDLLNNEAIAMTIIDLLQSRPDRPVTIGVHGDWGAGKSSVLEMIEAGLERKEGVVCLKFNGWRFQGFEDAKIALIEGIVTGLVEKRPALARAGSAVKDVFRRIDWLKVAKKAGSLAFTAYTGIPSPDLIRSVAGTIETFVADPTKDGAKETLGAAADEIRGLLKPADDTKHVSKEINEFRKAFDQLLAEAGVTQLIVLIDDLDRCLPDTAIETLEAVRLFVFTSRTAFVVAADEAMIEYAVRKHFPDLPDTSGPRDYARNYLEKLIQVPFRIPPLGEAETRIYVTLLLVGAELEDGDEDYAKLIGSARERLRKPWASAALDLATVKEAFGERTSKFQQALTISDQIGPILATGTSGNPRQLKRFLNTLLLRQRMAQARGFGDEVKLPVLAKLMLAERFIPALFEQIAVVAASHPSGYCELLSALEQASRGSAKAREAPVRARKLDSPADKSGGASTTGMSHSAPKPELPLRAATAPYDKEDAILTEWLASQPIVNWARLEPLIAETDLRPYLFVSKDRKDYFGATTALGHLAAVVERLLGPEMTVRGMENELRQLAQPEAGRVFEALRTKILAVDDLSLEPSGAAGLGALVRAQPSLQSDLLTMLEGFPTARCGPWIVTGWTRALTDQTATTRFQKLLSTWAERAESRTLKSAAAGVLKLPQRPR